MAIIKKKRLRLNTDFMYLDAVKEAEYQRRNKAMEDVTDGN